MTGIDHGNLVDERITIHQLALENDDLFSDRLFLVQSWNTEADRHPSFLLCPDKLLHVPELAVMKRVCLKPVGYFLIHF